MRVTPKKAMAYSVLAMTDLPRMRAELLEKLPASNKLTGDRLKFRIFYLGPRREYTIDRHTVRPAATLKADAVGFKIALYKVVKGRPVLYRYL